MLESLSRIRRSLCAAIALGAVTLLSCEPSVSPTEFESLEQQNVGPISAAVSPVSGVTTTGWEESPNNPVFDPGRAYYPSVIKDAGQFKMWYSGTSVGGFGIEMATSPDGISWSSPADASTGLASFSHHSHVEKIEGEYRIWYWDCCQRDDISVLRTATSTDGTTWSNDQALQQVEGDVIVGGNAQPWNRFALGLEEVLYNPDGSTTIV